MDEGSTAGRPIHCKAAVQWGPGEKYKIETVVVAPPKKNQVRVKILYASICHTDVTVGRMKAMEPFFPVIPGHEAVGYFLFFSLWSHLLAYESLCDGLWLWQTLFEVLRQSWGRVVESVGEGVTNVQSGDSVMPFMQGQCGACSFCKSGRTNTCKTLPMRIVSPTLVPSGESHFTTENGKVISIFGNVSAFSEYTVLNKDNVAKLSPEVPLENLCVLTCGVGTGVGAVWNIAKVFPGSTVAVFGLGTVGLAVTQACKIAGASRIIGVDINTNKFQIGKDLGLTHIINPKEHDKSLSTVIKELTGGGVDFSFECAGVIKLMSEAVLCTVVDFGLTVILGVPATATDTFQINVHDFLRGKSMFGAKLGGLKVSDLPEVAKRCLSKDFQLEPYITHKLPFSQIEKALEIFDSGECLRCVLQMGV